MEYEKYMKGFVGQLLKLFLETVESDVFSKCRLTPCILSSNGFCVLSLDGLDDGTP